MGVFAIIGLAVCCIGAAKWDQKGHLLVVLGLILFGIGVAGNTNGY